MYVNIFIVIVFSFTIKTNPNPFSTAAIKYTQVISYACHLSHSLFPILGFFPLLAGLVMNHLIGQLPIILVETNNAYVNWK